MYISNSVFTASVIFIVFISIAALIIVIYYSTYTSAPSVLHGMFTTEKGDLGDFTYESHLEGNTLSVKKIINLSSLNYNYDDNTSWSLWQLVRLTSYANSMEKRGMCSTTEETNQHCHEVIKLPHYNRPEAIMGANQNNKIKKLGMCYHNPSEKITVLAFNGTSNAADWRTDMDFTLVQDNLHPNKKEKLDLSKIHRGFRNSYLTLQKNVEYMIKKYNLKTKEGGWYITGHSLGAAIATLVAYNQHKNFNSQPHVYTFGQPRIGNQAFSRKVNDLYLYGAYRITNTSDIISSIPPPIWFNNTYDHVFQEYQFSDNTDHYSQNHIQSYQTYLRSKVRGE